MPLYRMIYKSKAVEPITSKIIDAIEEVSSMNNKKLDISGLLVANKTSFMQVLEGEKQNVNRVFQRICKDARHSEIEILSFGPVEVRAFDEWAMKGIGLGLIGRIINQRLVKKFGEEDADLILPSDGQKAFALLYDVAFLLKTDEI